RTAPATRLAASTARAGASSGSLARSSATAARSTAPPPCSRAAAAAHRCWIATTSSSVVPDTGLLSVVPRSCPCLHEWPGTGDAGPPRASGNLAGAWRAVEVHDDGLGHLAVEVDGDRPVGAVQQRQRGDLPVLHRRLHLFHDRIHVLAVDAPLRRTDDHTHPTHCLHPLSISS